MTIHGPWQPARRTVTAPATAAAAAGPRRAWTYSQTETSSTESCLRWISSFLFTAVIMVKISTIQICSIVLSHWAKRWLFSNLQHPPSISYHVPRALKFPFWNFLKWPISELLDKIFCPEDAQNWRAITFSPKVPCRVWVFWPKDIWAGAMSRSSSSVFVKWTEL